MGDEYEVSFQYEALTTSGTPLVFTHPGGGINSLNGSGFFIDTFNSNSVDFDLRWQLVSGDPAYYRVTNLVLRKRVFA